MTSPKQKAEYLEQACRSLGEHEGRRCRVDANEAHKTVTVDEAKLRSAAQVMRMLISLREMARTTQGLGPAQIQAAIDGFDSKADIDEEQTPMGGIVYVRKVAA